MAADARHLLLAEEDPAAPGRIASREHVLPAGQRIGRGREIGLPAEPQGGCFAHLEGDRRIEAAIAKSGGQCRDRGGRLGLRDAGEQAHGLLPLREIGPTAGGDEIGHDRGGRLLRRPHPSRRHADEWFAVADEPVGERPDLPIARREQGIERTGA